MQRARLFGRAVGWSWPAVLQDVVLAPPQRPEFLASLAVGETVILLPSPPPLPLPLGGVSIWMERGVSKMTVSPTARPASPRQGHPQPLPMLPYYESAAAPRGPALRCVLVCTHKTFTKGRSAVARMKMDLPFHNRLAFTGEVFSSLLAAPPSPNWVLPTGMGRR